MKKNTIMLTAFLINALLFISSCKKEISTFPTEPANYSPANKTNLQDHEKKIYVSTLEELYTAVNDPGNEGSQVIMSAGNYVLSPTYPNGGRLELQPGMTLQGQPGQPESVLIDESSLPAASFAIPAGRTGGIRMGRGTNTLKWLSVKGGAVSANPFSVINTDLLSTETSIGIYHVNIDVNGSNIGINLRNRLAEHAGRKIYAELKHNEITGAVNFNGFALAIQNANGASASLISVNMKENFIHGNKVGILAFNSAQTVSIANSTIEITSHADRVEGNGCGIDPTAGVCQAATVTANNNTLSLKMYGSSISGNNPPNAPQLQPVNGALPGGLYAACAFNSVNNIAGYNRASNNLMTLEFWGCNLSDNNSTDIYGYGAWCPPATVLAGMNNLLEISLHGNSANATVNATASVPTEPAATNVVNVFRN